MIKAKDDKTIGHLIRLFEKNDNPFLKVAI
jgi:hypothetical protein